MTGYIITIGRDPEPGSSEQTTLRLDLSALDAADLPNIDLERLVSALAGEQTQPRRTVDTPAGPRPARPAPVKAVPARPTRADASQPTSQPAVATPERARPEPRPESRRAGKAKRIGRTVAAIGDAAGRSYRKMPDPEEVLAVYHETGSITALAEHYDVPRHTAQGWAGRLRRLGYQIGRS